MKEWMNHQCRRRLVGVVEITGSPGILQACKQPQAGDVSTRTREGTILGPISWLDVTYLPCTCTVILNPAGKTA